MFDFATKLMLPRNARAATSGNRTRGQTNRPWIATNADRTRDLQIFSLTLSQLSYAGSDGGPFRDSNPGPLPPKGRIMPLDQTAAESAGRAAHVRPTRFELARTNPVGLESTPLDHSGTVAKCVCVREG